MTFFSGCLDMLESLFIIFLDNKIIVCGGMGMDTNPKDTLCAYDAESNTWKAMKGMPTPRYATYSFLVNEKLYVCGKFLILLCNSYISTLILQHN